MLVGEHRILDDLQADHCVQDDTAPDGGEAGRASGGGFYTVYTRRPAQHLAKIHPNHDPISTQTNGNCGNPCKSFRLRMIHLSLTDHVFLVDSGVSWKGGAHTFFLCSTFLDIR